MKIILASKSKRRKKLLEKLNLKFTVVDSCFDESTIFVNHSNPEDYCLKQAYEKANLVSERYPSDIIIGSDTIVYHDKMILGKPKNKKDAIKQLKSLSNNEHFVFTSVNIINKKLNINESFTDKTMVKFYKLKDEEILFYIDKYKPFDKAGSYGIQNWSSIFVEKINGCYYNVVGFPLPKFYKLLHKLFPGIN